MKYNKKLIPKNSYINFSTSASDDLENLADISGGKTFFVKDGKSISTFQKLHN